MEFEFNSIYRYNKSFKERYDEYCSILGANDNEMLSIHERWSHYLEFSFSITSNGWNAYWNILRNYCDKLKISFPKVAYIQVLKVNYETLSADVSIINARDDDELDSISEQVETVPLKDLYVTTSQEDLDLDVSIIAECLDQLRIFYHHLWWPWADEQKDDSESIDWVSFNLEHRLRLYYDKLEGQIHYVSAKTIKRLMEKCKEFYDLLQTTGDFQSDIENSSFLYGISKEINTMEIDLSQWSIPEIRKLKDGDVREVHSQSGALLTLPENHMKDVATYLLRAQEVLGDLQIKMVSPSFELCILNYNTNDIILLTPGNYKLNYIEYFDFAVSMKGLPRLSTKDTVISDTRSFWSIFQFLASNVSIENIDFDLHFCRTVFIVKRGVLTLNEVNFNNFCSKNSTAIHVYKKAKLIARRCRFSNFSTSIVCMQEAVVELDDCIFENNFSCVQIVEGAQIKMNNCDLKSTKNIPFIYEKCSSEYNDEEKNSESLDYLLRIDGVTLHQVQLPDETRVVENV